MPAKKPFEVKVVKGSRIHAISFSLDSTRPDDYYEALEKSLAKLKIDGEVLLDLLACNGETTRRFFTVQFIDGRLMFNTMRVAKEAAIEPNLLKLCSSFYAKNVEKICDSVLSTPARKSLSSRYH